MQNLNFFKYGAFSSILSAALLANNVWSITNIESRYHDANQQGLKGAFQISLSGKSGNSDKQTISMSGQVDYLHDIHQFLTLVASERGESQGVDDTDNNFFHQRYVHHNNDVIALEAYVQYQDDAFKLLESRALIGGGIKFKLTPSNEAYYLNIGVGAYYTEEVYNVSNSLNSREDYARASSYINYARQLTSTTEISDTLYWQPRLSKPSDSYVYNTLSIAVSISESLALTLSLETQYDSDPVNNLERVDHSYVSSLELKF